MKDGQTRVSRVLVSKSSIGGVHGSVGSVWNLFSPALGLPCGNVGCRADYLKLTADT